MLKRSALILFFIMFSFSFSNAEIFSPEAAQYYADGVKAQESGNFYDADMFYKKVQILEPYNTKWQKFILNNRGVMFAMQGDMESAEVLFNEALKLDANYQAPKLNLGLIYEQRRTKLESIEYWLKILRINLDDIKPKAFVVEEGRTAIEEKTKKTELW